GGRIVAEDTPDQLSARLRRSEKISVTLKAPPANILERFREVAGVEHVLTTPDPQTVLLECALGRDIREEVARFTVGQNWGLLEMKPVSMTLEDVFLKLTQREDGLPKTDDTAETERH
ncbi:MAG: ABC transporter ATP-binding protein, partial [Nitrospira sp.]